MWHFLPELSTYGSWCKDALFTIWHFRHFPNSVHCLTLAGVSWSILSFRVPGLYSAAASVLKPSERSSRLKIFTGAASFSLGCLNVLMLLQLWKDASVETLNVLFCLTNNIKPKDIQTMSENWEQEPKLWKGEAEVKVFLVFSHYFLEKLIWLSEVENFASVDQGVSWLI